MRHRTQQNSLACSRLKLQLYLGQLLLQIGGDCLSLLLPFILFSTQIIILGFIRHLQQANLSTAGVVTLVMLQADFLLRQSHQLTKGGITAFDNALRAAKVGFHAQVLSRILRDILFYLIKDADIGMTEAINRLLHVTDDKQIIRIVQLIAAEQINKLTLAFVGVLKLVHHNIFIALLILLPQRLILLQMLDGQQIQIIIKQNIIFLLARTQAGIKLLQHGEPILHQIAALGVQKYIVQLLPQIF